jgi:vacuolar protein sorting-associated protein IST1
VEDLTIREDAAAGGASEGGESDVKAGRKASVNAPAGPEKDAWASTDKPSVAGSAPPPPVEKKLSPEEELAKRFERLKQLK